MGPHLTQCELGRGLPWSIQPFGHNTPTSNCVNIGLTVDPTIDPTVEITGQPVSRTQASDDSGRLPRYEAKCVERTRFQWGVVIIIIIIFSFIL